MENFAHTKKKKVLVVLLIPFLLTLLNFQSVLMLKSSSEKVSTLGDDVHSPKKNKKNKPKKTNESEP